MDTSIIETVAELVTEAVTEAPELIPEATQAATEIIESVTEVAQTADYIPYLEALVEFNAYQSGFLLFFVIVIVCYFVYKFFRIFI